MYNDFGTRYITIIRNGDQKMGCLLYQLNREYYLKQMTPMFNY